MVTQVTYSVDGTSQTEIANLDRAILVNQHVGRLEVPMQHLALMYVLDGVQQVP